MLQTAPTDSTTDITPQSEQESLDINVDKENQVDQQAFHVHLAEAGKENMNHGARPGPEKEYDK